PASPKPYPAYSPPASASPTYRSSSPNAEHGYPSAGHDYADARHAIFGLAHDLNRLLGRDAIHPLSATLTLTSVGNIVSWEYVGYNMLIFYSALRVIPAELYEAAGG